MLRTLLEHRQHLLPRLSQPRIVGWHRVSEERRTGVPALSLVERRLDAGERDRASVPPAAAATTELAQTGAALARTITHAMRSVVESVRAETRTFVPPATPALDMGRLTRQVYDSLERELRIEKERRGL
jgi:hypothetical protein